MINNTSSIQVLQSKLPWTTKTWEGPKNTPPWLKTLYRIIICVSLIFPLIALFDLTIGMLIRSLNAKKSSPLAQKLYSRQNYIIALGSIIASGILGHIIYKGGHVSSKIPFFNTSIPKIIKWSSISISIITLIPSYFYVTRKNKKRVSFALNNNNTPSEQTLPYPATPGLSPSVENFKFSNSQETPFLNSQESDPSISKISPFKKIADKLKPKKKEKEDEWTTVKEYMAPYNPNSNSQIQAEPPPPPYPGTSSPEFSYPTAPPSS